MTELSVVIPTFNGAERLPRALDALAAQEVDPARFEVIVVDDGSTDGTAERLAALRVPFELRVERQANAGPSAARNRGIAKASAPVCLFMDDDIVAEPGLVGAHLAAQRARPALVIGRLELETRSRSGLARHFADWWREHNRKLAAGERQPNFWDCFTGNMSAPTEALRAAGGFDEGLRRSEDVELGLRLAKAGLPIVFADDARAVQRHEKGFRAIVRDFQAAGAAAPAMWRRHPELVEHLPLGGFSQAAPATRLAIRALIAIPLPVAPLAVLDRVLGPRPRLFSLLQRVFYWRSFRAELGDEETWRRLTRGPVILMYHAVGGPGERAGRYVIPARRLRAQLRWLERRRPVISLGELVRMRLAHELPPPGSVVITFDDGYRDFGRLAAPLLSSRGMPATLFVVSGEAGGANTWDADGETAGRPLLDWDELRELAGRGFAIGAHTVSHAHLPELDPDRARDEVSGSRAHIERELGVPPAHFAYPYGESSAALRALVQEAGFECACGIEPAVADPVAPLAELPRIEVLGTRSLAGFALDVWRGRSASPRPRAGARLP